MILIKEQLSHRTNVRTWCDGVTAATALLAFYTNADVWGSAISMRKRFTPVSVGIKNCAFFYFSPFFCIVGSVGDQQILNLIDQFYNIIKHKTKIAKDKRYTQSVIWSYFLYEYLK